MNLFLFLKQIADMLYAWQFLDYGMVLFAGFMLVYQVILVHSSPKNLVHADYMVLALVVLATISCLITPEGYDVYFKVLSAYMLYFVGRVYAERIEECTSAPVWGAYLVIWLNFFHRVWRYKGLFQHMDNNGEFYYFKTDLTFGMLTGVIFITIWGKNRILKWVTIALVVPYMTLYSLSRSGWAMIVPLYFLLLCYLIEKYRGERLKVSPRLLLGGVFAVVLMILLAITYYAMLLPELNLASLQEHFTRTRGVLHTRGEIWPILWENLLHMPWLNRIFGAGWVGDTLLLLHYDKPANESHSLYMKLLFSTGFLGIAVFATFSVFLFLLIRKMKNRELFYLLCGFWFLFLGFGITYSSITSVQMSWFPFLFAGMAVSEWVQQEKAEGAAEN